jgi:Protein of unknown function (DUF3567)
MQMLYNSDSFVVVRFDVPIEAGRAGTPGRGGYEIVDKRARKEIYIEGALAESFQLGVQALMQSHPSDEEAFDDYIAGYTLLAQHPVVLH